MAHAPPTPPKEGVVQDIPYPFGKGYSTYALVVLLILGLLNYIDRFVVAGIGSHLIHEFGMTDMVYGALPLSFLIVFSVVAYPAARIAETRGRNKVIGIGVFLWSIATVFSGLSKSLYSFFASRMVLGIGEASYSAASSPLVSDYFPSSKRATVVSVINSVVGIGGAIGMLLGAQIASNVSEAMVKCKVGGEKHTICQLAEMAGTIVVPASEAHKYIAPRPAKLASGDHGSSDHKKKSGGEDANSGVKKHEIAAGVEVIGEWRLAFFLVGIPGLIFAVFSYRLKEPPLGYFDKLEQGLKLDEKMNARPALYPEEIKEVEAKLGGFGKLVYSLLGKTQAGREFVLINARLGQIKSVAILYANGILMTGAMGTLTHFLEPYITQNLGIGKDDFIKIGGAAVVGGMLGIIIFGSITDAVNKKLKNGTMWVTAIGAMTGAPFILLFLQSPDSWKTVGFLAFVVAMASFFLMGVSGPTHAACLDVCPPHLRTTMAGTYIFLIHLLGDGPFPFLVGYLSDIIGREMALSGLAIMCLASGAVALLGLKHYAGDKQRVLDDLTKEAEKYHTSNA